jgi:hypothetical protein
MKVLVTLLALSFTGCVTTSLTPAGEAVRVTSNPEVVKQCKFVGEVFGRDRMNGGLAGQWAAEENANRRIRNRAAEMGGNVVLLVTDSTGFSGSTKRGEAYKCTATSTP